MQTKDYDGVQEPKAAGDAVRSRRAMQHSAQSAAKDDPLAILDGDDRRPCYDLDKSLAAPKECREPPCKAEPPNELQLLSPEEAPEQHLYPRPDVIPGAKSGA